MIEIIQKMKQKTCKKERQEKSINRCGSNKCNTS